eukprot:scaffold170877_cov33-Tisochrysis_lutea.AAC.4
MHALHVWWWVVRIGTRRLPQLAGRRLQQTYTPLQQLHLAFIPAFRAPTGRTQLGSRMDELQNRTMPVDQC